MTDFERNFMDKTMAKWREMPFWVEAPSAQIACRAWLPSWPQKDLQNDYDRWLEYIRTAGPSPWRWKKDVREKWRRHFATPA